MCSALIGQLQSSVGDYMHQRVRNWTAVPGQHLCSARETVHQCEALMVIRSFTGTRTSIPKNALNQVSFQPHKELRPTKSPIFEYKETCTQSDTQENLYSRLPQAHFHVRFWTLTQASKSALTIGRMRT
jgi:hypothetical protein